MGNRRWQWCTVQFTVQGQDAVEVEVRGAPVIHAQGAANE